MAGKAAYAVGLFFLLCAACILTLITGSQAVSSPGTSCGSSARPWENSGTDAELDADQMQVAEQIVASVRAFPATAAKPHAGVIALATARQESGLRNLDYGDRDSLGAFQQRPSQGWGTPEEVRNVPHATTSFLRHLIQIPNWETRPVTDIAADVQRPADEYRGLYAQWVPLATRLVANLWPQAVSIEAASTDACATDSAVSAGGVTYPVPTAFLETDSHNWGGHGSHWSNWHTGTDFSVPCGTPVLAATAGTVEIDTSQAWAGTWLVKVVTAPGSVATWYAHMQKLDIHSGQAVGPGQQLGEAGARGNATGCHLHFEVHLRNGSIYGPDNVDPSRWLAQNAQTPIGR